MIDYYNTQCKEELSIEDLCTRTTLEPSISEYVEWIESIDKMYEKEFWHKKSVIENVCYDGSTSENIDKSFEDWTTEPNIQYNIIQDIYKQVNPSLDD